MLDDVPAQLLAGSIAANTRKLSLATSSQEDLEAELIQLTAILTRYNEANEAMAVKPSLDQLTLASKRIQLINAKLKGIEKRLEEVASVLEERHAARAAMHVVDDE